MENISSKNKDLSLPFIGMVLVAALLLSGCNLNSAGTSEEAPELEAAMESIEVVEEEAMEKDGEAMEKEDAMEKDEVSLAEPVETKTASYTAGAVQPFNKQAFDEAAADGKKVLLDFHADWCSTCRANEPVVKSAIESSGDVVSFKVDYDNAQDLRAKYGVASQSTYIIFEGGEEKGRALGALDEESVSDLLAK